MNALVKIAIVAAVGAVVAGVNVYRNRKNLIVSLNDDQAANAAAEATEASSADGDTANAAQI